MAEEVHKKEVPPKRRTEKIEKIIETREGFMVGIYEDSTNAEILGFANPNALNNQFKRTYLGKVLKYNSIEQRNAEIQKHKKDNKTFVIISYKKPDDLANGKKEPDLGILIGAGYNDFHDKAFVRRIGFYDPAFAKGCYEVIRAYNLKKEEESDDDKETFWPEPKDFWMKLGLGKEFVGTSLDKDFTSIRISNMGVFVKEIFITKIFSQE